MLLGCTAYTYLFRSESHLMTTVTLWSRELRYKYLILKMKKKLSTECVFGLISHHSPRALWDTDPDFLTCSKLLWNMRGISLSAEMSPIIELNGCLVLCLTSPSSLQIASFSPSAIIIRYHFLFPSLPRFPDAS